MEKASSLQTEISIISHEKLNVYDVSSSESEEKSINKNIPHQNNNIIIFNKETNDSKLTY